VNDDDKRARLVLLLAVLAVILGCAAVLVALATLLLP
jgi:hypothetical protein